jgi:hypothetical protein
MSIQTTVQQLKEDESYFKLPGHLAWVTKGFGTVALDLPAQRTMSFFQIVHAGNGRLAFGDTNHKHCCICPLGQAQCKTPPGGGPEFQRYSLGKIECSRVSQIQT